LFCFPDKYNSLSYEEGKWLDDFRIILDKVIVEVRKPQEYADIFEVARGLPILDSGNLFSIHFDSIYTNDEAQVFDFLAVELTHLWFEV
jgi:hypothetical protein